ncbi:MAG: NAD(P)H-dependent amine dehydrogenase family protein [Endozoicomonas sp.]
MKRRVVVWGTGNVGRPAIRAVLSHSELELCGVIVSNPEKEGVDAGLLAGLEPVGVLATRNYEKLLKEQSIDAVVYSANADMRPPDAIRELTACLEAGVNVVSTSFYTLLYPAICPEEMTESINQSCQKGKSSVLVSGMDPGWVMDILPVLISGAGAGITEIRCQEIFNYATYDQPEVVRNIVGFGHSMKDTPMMLIPFALQSVWEPMIRLIADELELTVDGIEVVVEREPLSRTLEIDNMGVFEEGTQGAFRFEVQGYVNGKPLIIMEHITRIDDECAPQWSYPSEGQGCHRVLITGNQDINLSIHAADHHENGPASGGSATAANRVVNLVPAVCEAKPGLLSVNDVPMVNGKSQIVID